MAITYTWRGDFENAAVNALHAEGFGHSQVNTDWLAKVLRHSLGWVGATDAKELAGFVNVAWDRGAHAFILDTMVAATERHSGIGTGLTTVAAMQARGAGCEWLHVDFEDEMAPFYFRPCVFTPTSAGLLGLA